MSSSDSQAETTPLFIPVILGTARQGRMSEPVARLALEQLELREGVETGLIDIRNVTVAIDDEGPAVQDAQFAALVARADGLVLVVPEYNHSFPGLLKHVLDSNREEYIHKAVGVCGVSAGGFGGTRVIEALLPVLRELGLVTIFWDGNFSGVHGMFDESGKPLAEAHLPRLDKFLDELIWMSTVLRHGRLSVPLPH